MTGLFFIHCHRLDLARSGVPCLIHRARSATNSAPHRLLQWSGIISTCCLVAKDSGTNNARFACMSRNVCRIVASAAPVACEMSKHVFFASSVPGVRRHRHQNTARTLDKTSASTR
eukprot:36320-Rhodomonas_salina.2